MVVSTLGDLLVDVIVRFEEPIAPDTDTFCDIEISAGGQAANVAAWVSDLGHEGRVICTRCHDSAGALAMTELDRRGVRVVGPTGGTRTGTVVSLARGDGTRSMLTDRGDSAAFDPSSLVPAWLEGSRWLHVSGYALASDPLRSAAARGAAIASGSGCEVSVDLASTRVIENVGAASFLELLTRLGPALVFGSEAEFRALRVDPRNQPSRPEWIIKRGAAGVTVFAHGTEHSYDALATTVVDATGAGDAFAAGYLVGGVETALAAAARCVAQNGAMP